MGWRYQPGAALTVALWDVPAQPTPAVAIAQVVPFKESKALFVPFKESKALLSGQEVNQRPIAEVEFRSASSSKELAYAGSTQRIISLYVHLARVHIRIRSFIHPLGVLGCSAKQSRN